jgi:aryl-alcohol dehydrogenase-like predicted oxidoreductase
MLTPHAQKPTSANRRVVRPGRSWPVLIAVALALALAGGCGGGSSTTTKSTATAAAAITKTEFVTKANAICAAADPNLQAENAKLAAHPTPAAVVSAVQTLYAPAIEAQITAIKSLGTPAGDQATVSRMLQLIEGDLHRVKTNPKLIVSATAFGDFAKVAHPYGLTAGAPLRCPGRRGRPPRGRPPLRRGGRWMCSPRAPARLQCAPVLTTLGSTGLAVSRVGLGLAALGRPGYINLGHGEDLAGHTGAQAMERGAHAVLDAAYTGGVRYFDAARSYGRAEAFLASWLARRGLRGREVTVGSKWGYRYTANWRVDAPVHEVKELTRATLARQLAQSRQLLGSHLRLYQIHSATLESGVLDDRAVLDELARLRASGVSVGITVSGPQQAQTIERALALGAFDTVQATWNLLERSAAGALAAAHAAGLGVIVKEALANGRLTARGGVGELAEAARRRGSRPDALALAAALAQPWADVVLSGATTVAQLEGNLEALDQRLDGDALERLEALGEDPVAYWQTRAALPWN